MDYNINFSASKLDKEISFYYQRKGFHYPEDLKEDHIADHLSIDLIYSARRTYSYVDDEIKLINIDVRLPKVIRKEHFFHEIGHVLRHDGSQLMMPNIFVDYQEMDSIRFTRYASLPFHMLIKYDLTDPFLIQKLSLDFNVNPVLCIERMQEIKSNCLNKGLYDSEADLAYS